MIILEILKRTRQIVAKGWCRGDNAQTVTGRPVPYDDLEATQYCLQGAVLKASLEFKGKWELVSVEVVGRLLRIVPGGSVAQFNDDPDIRLKDVLAVIDEAIAKETDHEKG